MKITELLQGIGSPVAFYPDLVPITGTHEAAIFLCQLTYWHGKQANPDGWIYKTQEEWFFEIGLTEFQQRNSRSILIERGFVEERYNGVPRRLEYRLQEENLNKIWDTWLIAATITKNYRQLNEHYGFLTSRGIQAEDIRVQIESCRIGLKKCHTAVKSFFKHCKINHLNPSTQILNLEKTLQEIAQSIEKSRSLDPHNQDPQILTNKPLRSSQTSPLDPHKQDPQILTNKPLRSLDLPSLETLAQVDIQPPTEITAKITQESTQKVPPTQFDKNWVSNTEEKVRLGQELSPQEVIKLAEYRLQDVIAAYRHSGRILDASLGDIKPEFVEFVRTKFFPNNPDASFALATIKKYERSPQRWDELQNWVQAWNRNQNAASPKIYAAPGKNEAETEELISHEKWEQVTSRILEISQGYRIPRSRSGKKFAV